MSDTKISLNPAAKEALARVIHQANKGWCEANGDKSQADWDDAPDWQKDSAKNGIDFVTYDPLAPIYAQHDNWMKVKLADGWKYGEKRTQKLRRIHALFLMNSCHSTNV